jgi:carboxylate-amine ligase
VLAALLRASLDAARPPQNPDGAIVLLSDGRRNSAWWEHGELAGMLDIPVVSQEQLERQGSRVRAVLDDGTITDVSVIYRRTDLSRLRSASGSLTWLGEALLDPLREGAVACVNGFGTGFGDDKLSHAYVEEMIRFYLGEEPAVRSVHTFDPRNPAQRSAALERVDELVVKPRDGLGGDGVIVCAHAEATDRERARLLLLRHPERVIAQEMVALSTCPTICGARLEPRHVDLRAFVYWTAEGPRALPGGLTRVALNRGTLVVNSSQNGGAKDTWVVA